MTGPPVVIHLGRRFVASMLLLGFLRENYVTLERLLYGYADLHLELGAAPLIGAIIWPYSIYISCCFAQRLSSSRFEDSWHRPGFLALVALFMISLVGFYEPLLERVGMARWQEGTLKTLGAPWIAVIGYSTLAVTGTALSGWLIRRLESWRLWPALVPSMAALALLHARGLQALKDVLGW